MLSINTNLSSLIAQSSLKNSTNILNQAVERMSTGYKINHAKDNAANYSIATNMTTQLNAYDVAADNVAMGMDLVTTAMDLVSMMQDRASRLQALSTQARNGTYGAQSIDAINSEANALISEITRLYSTSEYNGVSLFNRKAYEIADHLPQAGASGFIDETALVATASAEAMPTAKAEYNGFIEDPVTYTDEELEAMLASGEIVALDNNVTSFTNGQKYLITDKSELQRLATLVNSDVNSTGAIFILGADIDLSGENWTPIGDASTNSSYQFKGTFDGNGHVIKNLTIYNETKNYPGLFGKTASGSEIKNIGVIGGNIKGKGSTGGLVGGSSSSISNSYATGNVSGTSLVGGLVGDSSSSISNSYATGNVIGTSCVGGLVGESYPSISNSYATGNVSGTSEVGGLVGHSYSISNSYATGNVSGTSEVGGLVGDSSSSTKNSYATGTVNGTGSYVGGLVGSCNTTNSRITNSYALGNVSGTSYVGGLTGQNKSNPIRNSYALGNVIGTSCVGGLVGDSWASISNSYATGDVEGVLSIGGLAGRGESLDITESYAKGNVTADSQAGGLVGEFISDSTITNCYSIGNVFADEYAGGLVGIFDSIFNTKTVCAIEITNSAQYGKVSSLSDSAGNFIGACLNYDYLNGAYGDIYIESCHSVYSLENNIGVSFEKEYIENENFDPDASSITEDMYDIEYVICDVGITTFDDEIIAVELKNIITNLQVGINGDNSCQLNFDTNFEINLSGVNSGIETESAFNTINDFLNLLSEKSTQLGAIQNRLESALDSIEVNINNLTSSRSTIRDADLAEESATYIQQQILQQAAATLMSTANQSPAIALQLI